MQKSASLTTNLQYSIEFVKEQQEEFEEICRDISTIEKTAERG